MALGTSGRDSGRPGQAMARLDCFLDVLEGVPCHMGLSGTGFTGAANWILGCQMDVSSLGPQRPLATLHAMKGPIALIALAVKSRTTRLLDVQGFLPLAGAEEKNDFGNFWDADVNLTLGRRE